MASGIKKYQNVSYGELIQFSKQNPHRHRKLDPIEIHVPKSSQETSLDELGLTGYTAFNLNPSGVLSLLACISDPQYYSLAQKNVRTQMIIDLATSLQQETENLKHTSLSRKRKKIHDLIAAAYNNSAFQDKDYLDLFHGIGYMRSIQFILMKEVVQEKTETDEKTYESSWKGELIFSSDPLLWKHDNPVWIVDYRARWMAIPSESSSKPIHSILYEWLTTVEQKGWVVQWPEVEGTKTECVERLSVLSNWQESDKKLSKDVLSARLGKMLSMNLFTKWQS